MNILTTPKPEIEAPRPGGRARRGVTLKDVAARVGVHPMSVSVALNGGKTKARVSDETRQRIVEAAAQMGYRPNLAARALSMQKTNLIAVWTHDLASSYVTPILAAMQKHLQHAGLGMMICVVPDDPRGHWDAVPAVHWPVDGILAHGINFAAEDFVRTFGTGHPPMVVYGTHHYESGTLDSVGVDLGIGACEAMAHLHAQGYRRIAFLGPEASISPGRERFDAYLAAQQKIASEPIFISCVDHQEIREPSRMAVLEYLKSHAAPDAIFCHNDDMALGAYRALCELKLRVPHDVALVGCDGITDTRYLEIPLSTIITPIEEMCSQAWQVLQRRIAEPEAPLQHIVLPSHLEVRASSQRSQ